MGVILKYLINFPDADKGFKVSNDLLHGDFLIDVSVRIEMLPGANGTTFELQLIDLPDKKAQALNDLVKDPKKATIRIQLGYFDDPFASVLAGVFTEVRTQVEGESMVTRLKGQESAMHALRHTHFNSNGKSERVPFSDAAKSVLKDAFPPSSGTAPTGLAAVAATLLGDDSGGDPINTTPVVPNLDGDQNGPSFRGKFVMDVLVALAESAEAELVVTDQKVYIGKPVVNDDYKPAEFSRDSNLAVFRPFTTAVAEDPGTNRIDALKAEAAVGYFFTIAGDPKLRPGNRVFANVDGVFADAAGYRKKDQDAAEFRVLKVDHILNLSQGYTCEGVAVKVKANDKGARQQLIAPNKAEEVALRLSKRIKDEASRRPVLEVCAVNTYKEGAAATNPHRASLVFGQRFDKAETQPSVRAPVDEDVTQLFANKPIVSAFAWHKCGLVTPVYPQMKAVVAHNLGLTDDGLVTGFLWSEQPAFDPPQSKPGDWWLCLPVNFDGKTPTDSTSAVNDLIANNGHRVIEVSGLRITVGKSTLGTVGTRPTEGDDDDLVLEHKPSGTKLEIDKDGVLTIAGNKGTTLTIDKNGGLSIDCKDALSFTASSVSIKASNGVSIEGDVSINGNVDIQ